MDMWRSTSDQCISSFDNRKIETKKKIHVAAHQKEKKPYKKVTEFILYHKNDCLFLDGTTKWMMMIIGERKCKERETITKHFKQKKD